MELSANRRYTSKLVLEDTTTVFQKTKDERSEKIKGYTPYWGRQQGERSQWKNDIIRVTLRSEGTGWLQPPCHMHPDLYKCLLGSCTTWTLHQCSSALLVLWVSRWVLSAVWWLVNYTLQQRNWRGPGGLRKQQAWLGGRLKTLTEF